VFAYWHVSEGSDEDDEEESESESEDDEDDEEDGDQDDEEESYDLDICPMACDTVKYDQTCDMRELRTDVVMEMLDLKMNKELQIKELENLFKKMKGIEATLFAAEQELDSFQVSYIFF